MSNFISQANFRRRLSRSALIILAALGVLAFYIGLRRSDSPPTLPHPILRKTV